MAYIDSLLSRGEQITYIARQHIFVLIYNILAELLLISLFVAAGVVSNRAFNNTTPLFGMPASNLVLMICVVLSVIVLISGFLDYIRWNTEQYVITDRRVIQVRGIFNKRVTDSSLEKINDVEFRQSLIGRMLNFGTVEILTASGDEGVNKMDRIEYPLEFKKAMLDAKHNYERGYGYFDAGYPRNAGYPRDAGYPRERAAPPPPSNYPSQRQPAPPAAEADPYAPRQRRGPMPGEIQRMLEDLAALRDRGILSAEEFETKKAEILRRL